MSQVEHFGINLDTPIDSDKFSIFGTDLGVADGKHRSVSVPSSELGLNYEVRTERSKLQQLRGLVEVELSFELYIFVFLVVFRGRGAGGITVRILRTGKVPPKALYR